jgi:hypothetical protein
MVNKDWSDPQTWSVGDTIDAETWIDRVYDPLALLLRKPLLVARRTTDLSVAAGSVTTLCSFDTIDSDDDGMVQDDVSAANVTDFYAQRDGVYGVWGCATWASNTHQGTFVCATKVWVNGLKQGRRAGAFVGGGTTTDNWKGYTGSINLTEGDKVNLVLENHDTGTALNIISQFNSPRLAIMWLRPLGS